MPNPPRTFGFGPFLLIPERQQLLRAGTPVRIGCRALDLLTALVERPGELVTKAELMARAWPDTVVEEANLKVNIWALRRALDEVSDAPDYIATAPGRGYRFVASVQTNPSPTPERISIGAAARVLATTKEGVLLIDLSIDREALRLLLTLEALSSGAACEAAAMHPPSAPTRPTNEQTSFA